jgi:hypothetical protein
VGRFFLPLAGIFLLLLPLDGASLRDGSDMLSPRAAEEFFRRGAELVAEAGETVRVTVDGTPVCIAAAGDGFLLTFCGRTISITSTMDPLQPIDADLPLAPFDLFCPFFRWPDVCYEGPGTALGRTAQRFTATATNGWTVRVWLDAKFYYPLCWELRDANRLLFRRLRLRSIAQNSNGEWCMRRMQIIGDGRTVTIMAAP